MTTTDDAVFNNISVREINKTPTNDNGIASLYFKFTMIYGLSQAYVASQSHTGIENCDSYSTRWYRRQFPWSSPPSSSGPCAATSPSLRLPLSRTT